ncbi:MAG: hypothetical protein Q9195_008074 [Heterodermia aff. obscurata]
MAQISALMKAPPTRCGRIVAGLVGGDMNTISQLDAASHKAENVELRDIWEDISPPPIPQLKPFQKDLTLGRARGNTWGYQSRGPRARKRLDKFFYTGSADTVPLLEAQDLTGKIGRLGIGVKTKVEVCEYEQKGIYKVGRGRWVEKWVTDHIDPEREWRADLEKYPSYSDIKERHKNLLETGVRKEIDVWVSDHFGITVGLRGPYCDFTPNANFPKTETPVGRTAMQQYQDAIAYKSHLSYDLYENATVPVDHEPSSLYLDNTSLFTEHHTMFDDPVICSSNASPHPLTASNNSKPGLESVLSKPESNSAVSARIEKRKANTHAARRYRQNRLDKLAKLESALKATQLERDALKVQVAKLEGETQVLREIIGERRMESC